MRLVILVYYDCQLLSVKFLLWKRKKQITKLLIVKDKKIKHYIAVTWILPEDNARQTAKPPLRTYSPSQPSMGGFAAKVRCKGHAKLMAQPCNLATN